ncbi:MAG: hypothetical protein ABFS30_04105 [Pseudomonadota bacterium]
MKFLQIAVIGTLFLVAVPQSAHAYIAPATLAVMQAGIDENDR